ncbi:hypothetical protein Dimus_024011 [Dionaea muscipula]
MLLSVLDGFKETEFWFVDRGVISVAAEDDDHRNGKECLGDIIYRYITAEQFSTGWLLDSLDLSTEHQTLKVRVEAIVHVWKLKDRKRCGSGSKSKRSSWGGKVKGPVTIQEKNQVLAHRVEDVGQPGKQYSKATRG